jgi:predicted TIM-barrel fold metal-dependent hydrolase
MACMSIESAATVVESLPALDIPQPNLQPVLNRTPVAWRDLIEQLAQLGYNAPVIIDFHTHVFSPRVKERRSEYVNRDPCFALLYSNPKAKLATAEELVASMDEAQVDLSVILNIGWMSHQLCVETNEYILESIARYPDRLIGFCSIQPTAGDAAIAELERCASSGARGIGEIRSDVQGFNLTDRTIMEPATNTMVKHDLILLTHSSEPVGHQYTGKGTITPDILYSFILAFPQLKLVCAHWGGGLPFYGTMPEVASAFTNVFFDTAATVFLYEPHVFTEVSHIVGDDKILFGSDYPLTTQSRPIAQIRSLQLAEEQKARILGDNARVLLSIA